MLGSRAWVVVAATALVAMGLSGSSARAGEDVDKLLQQCEAVSDHGGYINCLRSHREEVDHGKNSGMVGAFYALLDEIEDVYNRSQDTFSPMTDVQARANVYRAWQSTIAAANVHQGGRICAMNGNILLCR